MKYLRFIPVSAIAATLLAACASIGRPEGGPRDEDPPVFVRSDPMPGELNVNRTSFSIYFNENVELEDAFNKIIVSPVQTQAPQVSANGRRVTVMLRDTLVENSTYTIDFGDAIKDLNEGNILDGFALDFSTGDTIDTLRISGLVLAAETLEPQQGVLVGAYSNLADSAFTTLPPSRVARTNQFGQFTIRNLPAGEYRIYALNDVNRDNHWDRSEDAAFLDYTVSPSIESITVTDTVYDSKGQDSLITRDGIRYLPNDVLLSMFNQNYKAQYIKDYTRLDRRRAIINLGAEPDTLPRITMVGGKLDGRPYRDWGRAQFSTHGDSLQLWLTDTAVVNTDSLYLAVSYRKPDSLDVLKWTTDTLKFFYKAPRENKKSKKEVEADTLPPKLDLLEISVLSGSAQEVNKPLGLRFNTPIATLDTTAIRLETLVDTIWEPLPPLTILPASSIADTLLQREIDIKWIPGQKYKLTIDSASIFNMYGEHNPPLSREFSVKKLDEYSKLTFNLTGCDTTAVVELLNSTDSPVKRVRADRSGRAVFDFLDPGTYYARVFIDSNGDGIWTTGLVDSIQPEEVSYYPKKIEVKSNWEIDQPWDIYELPVNSQKPYAILKNKPKLKRGEQQQTEEEEEDEDPFLGPNQGNRNSNNNRNNNRISNGRMQTTGNGSTAGRIRQ